MFFGLVLLGGEGGFFSFSLVVFNFVFEDMSSGLKCFLVLFYFIYWFGCIVLEFNR